MGEEVSAVKLKLNAHILPASGAGGKESLVPFVEAGDERGHKKSETRPLTRPGRQARTAQRRSPGAEQEETQHKIAGKMA